MVGDHVRRLSRPTPRAAADTLRFATASAAVVAYRDASAARMRSLDAFRGIVIAAMILVNNPGSDADVYAALRHALWNGWTSADLIFPAFLFITGVALTFSLDAQSRSGTLHSALYVKIARRSLVMFGLGLFLNGFPLFDWSEMRIPGVLQRIALCYFFAALTTLWTGLRGRIGVCVVLTAASWMVMLHVPDSGGIAGVIEPDTNLAAYIDTLLLHGHLLHGTWDPEGLLTTLPALATTLTGVLAGQWLRSSRYTPARLLFVGSAAIGLGLVVDHWCPINKNLWTMSYLFLTAGVALSGLAVCHWLIDVRGHDAWALPFLAYGTNPIVVYVLSTLVAKDILLWRVPQIDGSTVDLQRYVFDSVFLPWASPLNASLLYAASALLFWLAVAGVLYRHRVMIKI